jgi:uncharacterized protein (TIGR00251 family)
LPVTFGVWFPLMLHVEANAERGTVVFSVRVQPRASENEISGETEGALRIRLRAPASEGRANESLVAFLAEVLNTSKAAVRILSGARGRVKRIEVRGVTEQQVQHLLQREA